MKADLSLPENRDAFIAMYFGQKVFENGYEQRTKWYPICHVDGDKLRTLSNNSRLSLRPISSLTTEEGNTIRSFFPWQGKMAYLIEMIQLNEWIHNFDFGMRPCDLEDFIRLIDYLRSIGILIPFRGNSCEEIIEAGLCVYREEGE